MHCLLPEHFFGLEEMGACPICFVLRLLEWPTRKGEKYQKDDSFAHQPLWLKGGWLRGEFSAMMIGLNRPNFRYLDLRRRPHMHAQDRRLDKWIRTPLVLVFFLISSFSNLRAQRWADIDGFDVGLLHAPGNPAALRELNPHHSIRLYGPQLDFSGGPGVLLFVNKKKVEVTAHVPGSLGGNYAGLPSASFPVPILDVGYYRVFHLMGSTRELVAEIAIPAFRCYFNRPGDPRQASSMKKIVPFVDLPAVMASYLDRAKHTVDIAMSDFDHPAYVAAVIRAHRRGVQVRFISDARAQGGEPHARKLLKAAGVPFITNERDLTIPTTMHHKLMIVDHKVVLMGHAKGNVHHTHVNQSFVSIIGKPLAAIYLDEFNGMWGGVGLDSPKEKRLFAKNKTLPRHRFCLVDNLEGKVRIDVGFAPSRKPTGSAESRPINILLAALISRAQSDIGFLASGFGDTDVGKIIHEAVTKRGVKFYGVQGDPDWHLDHNNLVQQFQGLGKDGWRPPADVVGAFDMDEEGKWVNVHNRVMVIDVLGKETQPVACFSSGAWRMGFIKADDSMVCIHDRSVAEQLLQHVGGTRIRSHAALPHRNIIPTLRLVDGVFSVPGRLIVPLFGGRVEQNQTGGVLLRLGKRALLSGDPKGFRLPAATMKINKITTGADLYLPGSDLAPLGIQIVRVANDSYACRGPNHVLVPLKLAAKAPAGEVRGIHVVRQGEALDSGLIFVDEVKETIKRMTRGGLKRQVGGVVTEANGLAVIGDSLPQFVVEKIEKRPILAEPQILIALDQALFHLQRRFGLQDPFVVVDGAGLFGKRARGLARAKWRSRRGGGLVFRVPKSYLAKGGPSVVRELVRLLMTQGITRIGIDQSLLKDVDVEEFLVQGKKGSWSSAGKAGLFKSKDRRTFVFVGKVGLRQVEIEQTMWDFRSQTGGDRQ